MQQAVLLFDPVDRPRGEDLRDEGISRAIAHADRVDPEWSDRAYKLAKAYVSTVGSGGQMTSEMVRAYAQSFGLSNPPDKRAWGAVMLKLAKSKVIVKKGWTTATDPKVHCNPISLWEVA